ncbi:MAG: helix-turn-helix domain-containing protein [Planctomycetota bacterium]
MRQRRKSSQQQQIDFHYFERDSLIGNAELPATVNVGSRNTTGDRIRSLLYALNFYFGKKSICWPSQESLAARMGCGARTVQSAIAGATRIGVLIVIDETCKAGRRNHYRVVWTELAVRDPAKRHAVMAAVRGDESVPPAEASTGASAKGGDGMAPGGDGMAPGGDGMAPGGDGMVPYETPITTKEKTTNHQPPTSTAVDTRDVAQAAAVDAHGWEGVGDVLNQVGLGDVAGAIAAAKRRRMAPADVLDLAERYRRLAADDDSASPGRLHRWISGRLRPPEAISERGGRPVAGNSSGTVPTAEASRLRAEGIRSRVVKQARRSGCEVRPDDPRLREQLREQLRRAGIDPDFVQCEI